jgi:hypothetical protein
MWDIQSNAPLIGTLVYKQLNLVIVRRSLRSRKLALVVVASFCICSDGYLLSISSFLARLEARFLIQR